MIRYGLTCEHGHAFEAWFRGSDDFDAQAKAGTIACPTCGATNVTKQLMAPSVVTARSKEGRARRPEMPQETVASASPAAPAAPAPPAQAPQQPVALADPKMVALVETMREIRKQVTENAENVGDKFAEVARRIHYGEEEQRGIYGEATPEDASALLEEGVEVFPLPLLPEDRN